MKTPPSSVSMRMYNIIPRPVQFHWYQLVLLGLHVVTQWLVWMQIAAAGWAPHSEFLPLVATVVSVLTALSIWFTSDDSTSMYGMVAILGTVLICWYLEPIVVADVTATLGADVASRLNGYSDTLSEVALHALRWWRLTMQGESAHDLVLFVATLALLCLSLAMTATWMLFRLQLAWVSIVCSGVPLLINHAFVPKRDDTVIMLFVIIAMLLAVINHISVRHGVWQSMRVDHPASTPLHVLWQAVLLLVPITALAMLLPLPANNDRVYAVWQALRSPFTTVRTSWETLFGNGGVDVAGGFAQQSVAMAGPRQRNEQVVLRVETTHPDYLRATSFDWYTGSGWQRRAATDTIPVAAGQAIANSNRGAIVVTSKITLTRPRNDNLLLSIGIPANYGVDAQMIALRDVTHDGNSAFAIQSDIVQNTDTVYTATSLLSSANENDLRAVGAAPAAINDVYLPLPDTLPTRITALARSIVVKAGATTQYDKVMAIQGYLRGLTYDESRQKPPSRMDWVEYMLFESQRGYCDDFATAMVVMLRTQGIPARFVQGYVLADRDPIRRDYVVRESLAHSWVEVYFDGYGWQRFEPTPTGYTNMPNRAAPEVAEPTARPTMADTQLDTPRERPTPTRDLSQFEPNDDGVAAPPTPTSPWWYVGIALATLAGLVAGVRAWWRRLHAVRRLELQYAILRTLLQRSGLPVSPSTTAHELTQLVAAELPAISDAVRALCMRYDDIHYAQRIPDDWPVIPWGRIVHTCAHYRWQQWWGAS